MLSEPSIVTIFAAARNIAALAMPWVSTWKPAPWKACWLASGSSSNRKPNWLTLE